MKTFKDYQTSDPRDGFDLLGRVLERLLEAKECRYTYRRLPSQDELDNWNARCLVVELRASFLPDLETPPEVITPQLTMVNQ
jgi:hypothetical protein